MLRTVPGHALVTVVTVVYLAGIVIVLLTPLNIVRYHARFWELTGQHLGLGWTAGREQALDAAVNIALFVPLGFLIHGWSRHGTRPSRTTVWGTIAFAVALAMTSETIQIFLPGRHASLVDVVMDVAGTTIGVALDSALGCTTLTRRAPPTMTDRERSAARASRAG